MATFSDNRPVRVGRTLNRQLGFITPTEMDVPCHYFEKRFVRHGVAIPENRAVCEKGISGVICDYQKEIGGLPMCLRYWYGPKYEIIDELPEPFVQKTNNNGQKLYFESDGVSETSRDTGHPIMIPLSKNKPIKYVEDNKYQEETEDGSLLYWNMSISPPQKTSTVTEYPVWIYRKPQFFSEQYEDSHGKIFGINGGKLGWHKEL